LTRISIFNNTRRETLGSKRIIKDPHYISNKPTITRLYVEKVEDSHKQFNPQTSIMMILSTKTNQTGVGEEAEDNNYFKYLNKKCNFIKLLLVEETEKEYPLLSLSK